MLVRSGEGAVRRRGLVSPDTGVALDGAQDRQAGGLDFAVARGRLGRSAGRYGGTDDAERLGIGRVSPHAGVGRASLRGAEKPPSPRWHVRCAHIPRLAACPCRHRCSRHPAQSAAVAAGRRTCLTGFGRGPPRASLIYAGVLRLPGVRLPRISLPRINLPDFGLPRVGLPPFRLPRVGPWRAGRFGAHRRRFLARSGPCRHDQTCHLAEGVLVGRPDGGRPLFRGGLPPLWPRRSDHLAERMTGERRAGRVAVRAGANGGAGAAGTLPRSGRIGGGGTGAVRVTGAIDPTGFRRILARARLRRRKPLRHLLERRAGEAPPDLVARGGAGEITVDTVTVKDGALRSRCPGHFLLRTWQPSLCRRSACKSRARLLRAHLLRAHLLRAGLLRGGTTGTGLFRAAMSPKKPGRYLGHLRAGEPPANLGERCFVMRIDAGTGITQSSLCARDSGRWVV